MWEEYDKVSQLCLLLPTLFVLISDVEESVPQELADRMVVISSPEALLRFFGPLIYTRRLRSHGGR